MCSLNDGEDGGMEAKVKPLWTSVCQKCSKENPVIQILQIKHAYCRDCFLSHVNHKFRSTLGKSKMMRPSDVALAAFSGSIKSHAMLHLLHAGLSEKTHKRFLFKVQLIYIDEGAVLGMSTSQRTENLRTIAELAESYGFSAHFTSLAFLYDDKGPRCFPLHKDSTLIVEHNLEKDLIHLFENLSSLTAKEDLLIQLRKQILLLSAKELSCNKIFMANTSTDLAIQILTDVSLGRGSQMHHDVSFYDERDENVKILRPLLELSSKEVTFYSVFHRLGSVFISSLCTKAPFSTSIHNLSKQFVMDLMENFPSTVSTIFRTGEKLGSASSSNTHKAEDSFCIICQVKLEVNIAPCTSAQATEFSRLISSLGPCGFDNKTLMTLSGSSGPSLGCKVSANPESCCLKSSAECKCGNDQQTPSFSDIVECCCYGCRLILQDMKLPSCLPKGVLEQVRTRKSRKNMRESIRDFLL